MTPLLRERMSLAPIVYLQTDSGKYQQKLIEMSLYLKKQDASEREFFCLRGGEVLFVGPIASFAASGGGVPDETNVWVVCQSGDAGMQSEILGYTHIQY